MNRYNFSNSIVTNVNIGIVLLQSSLLSAAFLRCFLVRLYYVFVVRLVSF